MALGLLGTIATSAALVGGVGCCALSAPRYSGAATASFDGKRFRNMQPTKLPSFSDLVRWQMNRKRGPWRDWTDAPPGAPPPRRVSNGQLRATFVNHATVLLQIDGLNILTDPIWSKRASPVSWAGPRRVRPAGLRFEDLPPIDAVLVSHNHYDHMDLPTLKRLERAHSPRFVVGLGNGALLAARGIRPAELDWWQSVSLARGVRVHLVPARHFSSRGLCDRDGALWGGFVVEGPSGRVYFAGDTGFGPHFAEIGERLGPIRLAMLPIGAFRPRWFMEPAHISPEEAIRAHELLGATTSLAVHFGTFPLGDDGEEEPVHELRRALRAARVPEAQFWVLGFGEGRDVPPVEGR